MLLYLSLNFFLISFCGAAVITEPPIKQNVELLNIYHDLMEKYDPHLLDFVDLIDVNKVVDVVMEHEKNDPELDNFFKYFGDCLEDLSKLPEVQQAVLLIHSNIFNTSNANVVIVATTETEVPAPVSKIARKRSQRVNLLIEEIIQVLPLDKMKNLLEKKLKTNADVAMLFEIITSEEFLEIVQRFKANPKVVAAKGVLEDFGLDFDRLNKMTEYVFGDYFEKISGINKNKE
ncbi:uncharacterized protein LOC126375318 [Pectinophora gossypiella]|uniref:uncharacterized protein LOC126375318 n=1 Tax=Pectinophora gossypiella TaxID=13191 RepID=UPI00214EE7D5|nr:uncharacterized protein LOC126375318 [Pectinophora gossypiella]